MKSKKGSIEYVGALMLVCFAGLIMFYLISVKQVKLYQIKIKDSVDTSALSAAIIDTDRLIGDGSVVIENPVRSRDIFERTLRYSLNLDDNLSPKGRGQFGQIKIHDFIVYSLTDGSRIVRYDIGKNGGFTETSYDYNENPRTPDGKIIEGATIYVDIGMNVTGFLGVTRYEHVRTSVDVIKDSEVRKDDDI